LLRALGCVALLCAGCAETSPGAPAVRSITPSQGPDNATTQVTIGGEGFLPRVVTDFARKEASKIDETYLAKIGASELTGVTRSDDATLTATVPSGLTAGVYDLTITDPYGREVVLKDAYTVSAAGVPVGLAFTNNPHSVQAGACSPAVTIQARDGLGMPVLFTANTMVSLASSSVGTTYFSDAACTSSLTSVAIAAGGLSGGFFFRATTAGPLTLTALAPGLTSASQQHTVLPNGAATLAFSTPALTLIQGACSPVVTVELRDSLGNAVLAPSQVDVGLSSAPAGGVAFFSDPACAVPAPSAAIAAGSATVNRYLNGLQLGSVTIGASATGLNPASQQHIVI
jgi:hypothetical protein